MDKQIYFVRRGVDSACRTCKDSIPKGERCVEVTFSSQGMYCMNTKWIQFCLPCFKIISPSVTRNRMFYEANIPKQTCVLCNDKIVREKRFDPSLEKLCGNCTLLLMHNHPILSLQCMLDILSTADEMYIEALRQESKLLKLRGITVERTEECGSCSGKGIIADKEGFEEKCDWCDKGKVKTTKKLPKKTKDQRMTDLMARL